MNPGSQNLTKKLPKWATAGKSIIIALLAWTLFQIYIATPLPFLLSGDLLLNSIQTRLVHYSFAIFITYTFFGTLRNGARPYPQVLDIVLGLGAASPAIYGVVFYHELAGRIGAPLPLDIVVACIGLFFLLEAVRRTTGLPLVIVALILIGYIFLGPYMPEVISHRGASLGRFADHIWLSSEGVFGFALGVSSSLVFLFVLFGTLLERAGAGNWFITVSFALLGHLRGGPAKASVVSSAMTGLISGSALANIVTTGTFTIPLMKRTGFSAVKAAAIESTSSINGQLMPPVMGAAAFLMTEFVGISYTEVITHAFLPAVISYIGLFYIVHLEALKMDLPVLERRTSRPIYMTAVLFALNLAGAMIIASLIYFGVQFVRAVFGDASGFVILGTIIISYLLFLKIASGVPDLKLDDPELPVLQLPEIKPTVLAGLHFIIPIVVLVWALMIERLSPSLAVCWAMLALAIIIVTQRPLIAFFRNQGNYAKASVDGACDLFEGLVGGAFNMAPIAVTLAAAGVVIGAVSLTGIALVMVGVIEVISGGNLLAILVLTALFTIVLGMGLPTTANYVVVATIMAPIIVTLSAQYGLVIPVIAVHMFVFYCGLMSGNTPPVAVDAYAAAALASANPMETCVQAFLYGARTLILPFIFVYNTELLLIGVDTWWHFLMIVVVAVFAMLSFVAASQGYMLTKNKLPETICLLVVAFSLAMPLFWIDRISPAFRIAQPTELFAYIESRPANSTLRIWARGEGFSGVETNRLALLPLGVSGLPAAERLKNTAGMTVRVENDKVWIENAEYNRPAHKAGLNSGWEIFQLDIANDRLVKEWVYPPALILLMLIILIQRRRKDRVASP